MCVFVCVSSNTSTLLRRIPPLHSTSNPAPTQKSWKHLKGSWAVQFIGRTVPNFLRQHQRYWHPGIPASGYVTKNDNVASSPSALCHIQRDKTCIYMTTSSNRSLYLILRDKNVSNLQAHFTGSARYLRAMKIIFQSLTNFENIFWAKSNIV